ncbi:lysophospholipid acyltransferase family protein [Paraferrimonas haliotis]|uniref:1-acyl-sn-glycerol-3-phosphate acyltransferase n=1 Tax=Paraferrimonas haliotis TaxID=2013866 RepID=A0AA37TPI3_9GAMM|nr:lysophospholipid acyltransferase family protein [Paraferrimonas haliotis]GLS83175.1 1-acyl-sn-glycerol-3-phosphate acyltransferase [Paraferrimonas haliotis]
MASKLVTRLSKIIRGACSGVSFVVFGIGGLFLSYVWFPLIALKTRDETQRQLYCQASISRTFRFFTQFMAALNILTIDVKNLQGLQQQPGRIIIASHPTLIDVVILMGYLRQCDCIVKADLWHNPFIKHVVSMAGYIPNQSEGIIEQVEQRLSQGRTVLIFPEGSRTPVGQAVNCQRGAAQLAVRSNASIQPVVIQCQPLALYKGCPWYNMPASPMHFSINVGEIESIERFTDNAPSPSTAARKLTRYFNEVLNQAP